MKICVFGYKGQLGNDLMQSARRAGIQAEGIDLPACDITRKDSVDQAFDRAGSVDLAINAAAYTAVDLAEKEVQTAFAVNRDGAGHLAEACRQRDLALIHISTDYVFDGRQDRPYKPDDAVNPNGVYARSKAAGEEAVRKALNRHLIVRISWLFGMHGNNFVKTMLRLGKEKETLQVVDDQTGSPTYAGDLAEALIRIAGQTIPGFTAWGTYHYCNAGAITWYAFARKVFDLARPYENLTVRDVTPIPTSRYPTPAPRPAYSVLDCTSFDRTFDISRRSWDMALEEMLVRLRQNQSAL